ncbi:apoptosis facilitator Bcl-2-like protein 14 [Pseudorasbora parva]|uniref:apoptosis facilitator Bcl-2-like protein 14 n=1 Tax=Pseudorasbora parva TaxID=51549 RepID=UPI00351F6D5E
MASISGDTQHTPQLLSVGEKDKKRLLEVYVKRSLSLNDGSQCLRRREDRSRKWVATAEQKTRDHKHTSLNLSSQASISDEDIRYESVLEPQLDKKDSSSEKKSKKWRVKGSLRRNDGSNVSQKSNGKPKKWFQHLDKGKDEVGQSNEALPQTSTVTVGDIHSKTPESSTVERKDKEGKKTKKPTIWKTFLSWFSKGGNEKEQDHQRTEEQLSLSQPSTPQMSCLPLADSKSKGEINLRRSKSLKKKPLHRRSSKWRRSGDMSAAKSVKMVEPTTSYYEKMSEELEKIVHEVKDKPADDNATYQPTDQNGVKVSQEEVIKRITELIKRQGDIIDDRLKENGTVSNYLDGITYRSFQQMADQYVQAEVPNKKTYTAPVVAPELVKFAFTLDFTAQVANLHRQATGHIMGFGNQYIQDRFTHMSESHPHLNDIRAEDQNTQNAEQQFVSL